MNYINPFSLFEINSLENSIIQKAKKEKLVQLALSKNHYVVYNEQRLNDEILLELAEELSDPEIGQYHRFIHKHPQFSDFLEFGSIEIFKDFPTSKVFQNDGFIDFLMPYLSYAFPIALSTAYHTRALDIFTNIQQNPLFVEFENPSFLLTDLKQELEIELDDIKHAYKVISHPKADHNHIEDQLDRIRKMVHINCLNALPSPLSHFRNSIALLCCSLSKLLYNKNQDKRKAAYFEFADIAKQLQTTGHASVIVQNTYSRFQKLYYQDLGIEVETPPMQWSVDDALLNTSVRKALGEINHLKSKLRNPTVEKMGFDTRQIGVACSILENVCPPSVFEHLRKTDYRDIRQQVLSDVYFILSKTATVKRAQTLRAIEHFAVLYELEPHFEIKFEQLENTINASIAQELVHPNFEERNQLKRISKQTKSKLTFLLEQLPPLPVPLRQFFDKDTDAKERFAKAFPLLITALVLFFLALLGYRYLTMKHEMSETQIILSEKKRYRWHTKDYTKEKFYVERSKYIGNQLANGATPFERCFGENLAVGKNELVFYNHFSEDAVVCVYDPAYNLVMQQAYIGAKTEHTFRNVPNGTYSIKIYLGKDWNPLKPNFCSLHGAFDTNPHYLKLKKQFNVDFSKNTTASITLDAVLWKEKFFDLSARAYFNNHVRNKRD